MSKQTPETNVQAVAALHARLVFTIILTATFLDTIDFAVVQVALPSIGAQFAASVANTQWVIGAYGISLAGFLLLTGRAGDNYGQKRIFVSGMSVFTIASLAGALAPSLLALVAFRFIQGIGAAMTTVSAFAIFIGLFRDEKERLKYYGIFIASLSAGVAVGVVAGGVLTNALGWQSVLLVNVPIGAIVLAYAQKYLQHARPGPARSRLDIPGALSITVGLMLLIYALTNAANEGLFSRMSLLSFGGSVIVLSLFLFFESRSKQPLLPLSFLRRSSTLIVNTLCILISATAGVMVLLIYYFQTVLGWSALEAAIGILPFALIFTIGGGWAAAKLLGKLGVKRTLLMSTGIMTIGLALLTQISPENYWTITLPAMLVFSVGASLGFPAIFAEAGMVAKPGEEGLASGVIQTSFRVGVPVGLAILLAIVGAADQSLGKISSPATTTTALTTGLQYGILAATFIGLLSFIVASRLKVPGRGGL